MSVSTLKHKNKDKILKKLQKIKSSTLTEQTVRSPQGNTSNNQHERRNPQVISGAIQIEIPNNGLAVADSSIFEGNIFETLTPSVHEGPQYNDGKPAKLINSIINLKN